jgi:uncharacterized membrane protein YhaH (DUF805 family)
MPTIILSYRRDDTGAIAGRIFDRLVGHYGADQVFMDIDSIPFGLDFREHIQETLKRCDVLLAIVGARWAAPNEKGSFRINEENDWVRIEVEAALAKNIPVIPVLIDNASLPAPASLPEGLRNLVFRRAAPVDSGRDFNPHMARLIKAMDQLLSRSSVATAVEPARIPPSPKPTVSPSKASAIDEADKRPRDAQPKAATGPVSSKRRPWREIFFSFQGRLARRAFWGAVIASYVIMLVVAALIGTLAELAGGSGSDISPLAVFSPLLWLWVLASIGTKRLHDFGWSGLWLLIPVTSGLLLAKLLGLATIRTTWIFFGGTAIAAFVLLGLGLPRGTPGKNRYGPDHLAATEPAAPS